MRDQAALDGVLTEVHAHGVEAAVDDALLDRLVAFPVDLARDDGRARDLELVALAPHGLDQDREMQLAAAADFEDVGGRPIGDLERDVGLQLALEPGSKLA